MWSLCSILIREGQDDEMVRVVSEAREACCRNEAKPVEAAPAEAKPVEAVPAVPRSAATNVLVRLCTS